MNYIYSCDYFSFNADLYALHILRNLLTILYKTKNSSWKGYVVEHNYVN